MRRKITANLCPQRTAFFILIAVFFLPSLLKAQHTFNWNMAAGVHLPVGKFSETHFPGAGAEVSFTHKRFGKLWVVPKKSFSYVLNGGIDFFRGRKRLISGYPVKYGGYSLLHTYGGFIYNHGRRFHLQLVAGPAVSLYKQNVRFNIGSSLSATCYISRQNGITPCLSLINEWGASALWAASIKFSRSF
ncbi:MAG: hypothetical protein U0U70_05165 [Chitinophagaceae bacterium]